MSRAFGQALPREESIKCYVERFQRADGLDDLRLREKMTNRLIRVLSTDAEHAIVAPMTAFLAGAYTLSGGYISTGSTHEYVHLSGNVLAESDVEIAFSHDDALSYLVV